MPFLQFSTNYQPPSPLRPSAARSGEDSRGDAAGETPGVPGVLARIPAGAERGEIGAGQPREDDAGRGGPEALGAPRMRYPDAHTVLPIRRPRLLDAHPEKGDELVPRPAAAVDLHHQVGGAAGLSARRRSPQRRGPATRVPLPGRGRSWRRPRRHRRRSAGAGRRSPANRRGARDRRARTGRTTSDRRWPMPAPHAQPRARPRTRRAPCARRTGSGARRRGRSDGRRAPAASRPRSVPGRRGRRLARVC